MYDSLEKYGLGFWFFFFPFSLLHPFPPSLSLFLLFFPFILLLFVFTWEKQYKGIFETICLIALLIEVILLKENGKMEASPSVAVFTLLKIQGS